MNPSLRSAYGDRALPNGFEMSGPSSTSIIHQALHKIGRISDPSRSAAEHPLGLH
jgi:hypothetical protein